MKSAISSAKMISHAPPRRQRARVPQVPEIVRPAAQERLADRQNPSLSNVVLHVFETPRRRSTTAPLSGDAIASRLSLLMQDISDCRLPDQWISFNRFVEGDDPKAGRTTFRMR